MGDGVGAGNGPNARMVFAISVTPNADCLRARDRSWDELQNAANDGLVRDAVALQGWDRPLGVANGAARFTGRRQSRPEGDDQISFAVITRTDSTTQHMMGLEHLEATTTDGAAEAHTRERHVEIFLAAMTIDAPHHGTGGNGCSLPMPSSSRLPPRTSRSGGGGAGNPAARAR